MKKVVLIILFIIFLIAIYFLRSCGNEKTILPEYKKGELLIIYKKTPTAESKKKIRDEISKSIDTTNLKIRVCSECDNYVELWQADKIETFVVGHGAHSGAGGGTKPVGEDTLAIYSLNMVSSLPYDYSPVSDNYIKNRQNDRGLYTPFIDPTGKDTITVAVIDTGIDTVNFNNKEYLWTNNINSDCYAGFSHGWNFVNNTANIFDDNSSKHGTIVSHYIINEFIKSPKNYVQIMSLKTHDKEGKGDLFSAICALHYAIKRKANIINASWGFYNFSRTTHPYLDSLITKGLSQHGIAFVAAAGNKTEEADSLIQRYYENTSKQTLPSDSIRKIDLNGFYPAYLGREKQNNVITVTTVFKGSVSPTQNYSDHYIDLGVKADTLTSSRMDFKLPFPANKDYLSGSSFAAAILSGKIGAYLPKNKYITGINKAEVIETLANIHTVFSIPPIIEKNDSLKNRNLVREGRFTFRKD